MAKRKSKVTPGPPREELKWQAEDDVRTLTRAVEIRSDKRRLARAQREADKQKAALEKAKKA